MPPSIFDTIRDRTAQFLTLTGARPAAGPQPPSRVTGPTDRPAPDREARAGRVAQAAQAAQAAEDALYRALYGRPQATEDAPGARARPRDAEDDLYDKLYGQP